MVTGRLANYMRISDHFWRLSTKNPRFTRSTLIPVGTYRAGEVRFGGEWMFVCFTRGVSHSKGWTYYYVVFLFDMVKEQSFKMICSSAVLLSKAGRTIVRDPRKMRVPSVRPLDLPAKASEGSNSSVQHHQQQSNLPFEPTHRNQEAIGSSMVSYMLAGAGMALGFTLVGAVFGGI